VHTDLPIACSLDADTLTQRLGEMSALGRDALLDVDAAVPGRAILRFRCDDGTRTRLEAIVAAEASCCAFMRFALANEPAAIAMTIEAPEGAELVVEDLLAAFADTQAAA
jgi:hypothetical protein